MGEEQRLVPVSLRGRGGAAPHFLPAQAVVFRDGVPAAIDHEGRRYVFSHTIGPGGYDGAATSPVYVFGEDES